jgi:hypothetical protein
MHKKSGSALAGVLLVVLLASNPGAFADSFAGPFSSPTADTSFTDTSVEIGRPWTGKEFDAEEGKFTFAVFSDLTGGEREGIFAVAAEQLRLLRPEFIIGVGDLIEGGTENTERLGSEWDSFDERAGRTVGPLFHVGGNHDLINPVQWEVWEERYGRRYYYFVYKDALFLVLDTEDNSPERQWEIHRERDKALELVELEGWGIYDDTEYAQMPETRTGNISEAQSLYFQQVIAMHPGVRWTFLFMHKPAWLRDGEKNFLAIEDALSGRPYSVFNGHNHDYVYRSRRGRDYIQLGTTGGVQLPEKKMAVDHITLVTVSDTGVDIANIEMAGIFDKTGHLPLNGDELCFEAATCAGD